MKKKKNISTVRAQKTPPIKKNVKGHSEHVLHGKKKGRPAKSTFKKDQVKKSKKPEKLSHKKVSASWWSGLVGNRKRLRSGVIAVLVGLIMLASFLIVYGLETSQTLDWDESVYALKARGWIEGTPDESFYVYRPIGIPAVSLAMAVSAQWFGFDTFSPDTLRLFGVVFAGACAAFLFLFVSGLSNIWLGLTTTSVVVGSTLFLRNAPLLQNDVASTGLLLGVMWCIWMHYVSSGRNRYIYGAVVLAIMAFYIRYGVALHLFVIGISTMILFLMRVYGRDHLNPSSAESDTEQKIIDKGVDGRKKKSAQIEEFYFNPTLKALVLFVVLLIPHIIQSLLLFNRNPFGILLYAGDAANREFFGEGLLDYVSWLPAHQAGPFIGSLSILGILTVLYLFFKRPDLTRTLRRKELTGMIWVMSIALLSFVFIGLIAHAEERYILFPLTLYIFAGLWSLSLLVRLFVPRLHRVTIGSVFLYSLYIGMGNIAITNDLYAVQNDYRLPIIAAGSAIKEDAGNDKCYVWSAEEPQTSWHSGCRAYTYDQASIIEYLNIYRNQNKYITVYNETDKVQPDMSALRNLGVVTYRIEVDSQRDRAEVYRVFYSGDGGDRLRAQEQDIEG